MKRIALILMVVCLLAGAVSADVLIELDDPFWETHQDDCDYYFRAYTVNGVEGYAPLWESPGSAKQVEVLKNGEQVAGNWHYTDGDTVWCAVQSGEMNDNGYEKVRGWIRVSDCEPVPDYLSFAEVHGSEFTEFDPAYEHALDGVETMVLWKYPGSGIVEDPGVDTAWAEGMQMSELFSQCWTDPEGRFWGFVSYCYGIRNTWVCLSDPANAELEPDPEVLEQKELYPPAEELPSPENGVSTLAVVLVACVVLVSAGLIAVLIRRKRTRRT